MSVKQYTQQKILEKPLPPKPVIPQQQNVLPFILAQNPASSSPQGLPVLVQSTDSRGMQMAFPHSAPSQHLIFAQPLVENQVSSFKSGSFGQASDNSTARTTYSPPRMDRDDQEAGTSYPHPRLASFNHESSPPEGSSRHSSVAESTTYPLVQYVSMPSSRPSSQSNLAMQLQNYEFPPGAPQERRLSGASSNAYELPSGARRRRRYSRANPAYAYDPFEASDVETDEQPARSPRSTRPSMSHRREDSFPPPSRQFQHHRDRRNSTAQDPALQEQSQLMRRRSRGKSLTVPDDSALDFEEEEHTTIRRSHSPSRRRPTFVRRRSNSLPPADDHLAVPNHTHTSRHYSRHHRYSVGHSNAETPALGTRPRAVSSSHPTPYDEGRHRHRTRKDSDQRSSRSKSRKRTKSRVRSKSTSYQPSDSDDSYSSEYERPISRLRDYLPDSLKGGSDNPHSKRNTMLGGLGGAVLGNAILPGVGTVLGPTAGALMGGVGGHEMSKSSGTGENLKHKAKKKLDKKQREWEAGRKAGEEEGRRIGAQIARRRAEELTRVQRRERGGMSMGGVGGGGGGGG